MKETLIFVLSIWNFAVFCIYGMDKHYTKRGRRRISEMTLLSLTALLGGIDASLGIYILQHKTRHTRFKIGVPLLMILNLVVTAVLLLNIPA